MNAESTRYVIDITSLIYWNRPPVGIIRTLHEIAKWFYINQLDEDVVFVRFSEDKSKLIILDEIETSFLLDRIGNTLFSSNDQKSDSLQLNKKKYVENLFFTKNNKLNKVILYYKKNGLYPLIKRIILYYLPWVHNSIGWKSSINEIQKTDASIDILFSGSCYIGKYEETILQKNDIFISLGLDWDRSNYELLYYLKKRIGFKFVGICYDLIPILYEKYVQSDFFSQTFFKHIYFLNHVADKISCISNYSKKTLVEFREKYDISNSVNIKTIYIGDNLNKNLDLLNDNDESNSSDFYILYVSTIESRKNHLTLLKAYIEAENNNITLPNLILVGMYGWGINEFQDLYKKSSYLKSKIKIYDMVDDDTLIQLYKNALFCVFPSYVEGWGLGAVEALLYGKVCLISDSEALKEATQNLMPTIETDNPTEWMNSIQFYTINNHEREKLEKVINQKFKSKSWTKFCEEFYEFSKGVAK